MDQIKNQLQQFRQKLDGIEPLEKAEQATNVPKEYLTIVGTLVLFSLIFFSIGAGSMTSIVGFIYPAYKSLLAIESKVRGDDTQWLIYWVVYCFFSIIELFADMILYWIPFYYAFKLAFLLWCMLPQTRGATFLYEAFLKDFLKSQESKIDQALEDAKKTAKVIGHEVGSNVKEMVSGVAAAAASSEGDKKDD
ncbi:hypothetical protein CTEN210_00999 [Chaetoceros tenuissimus]|uniref:Receptor expression-enhancing protein n=1 Tax=Chaetoceros tenuissimus TaxID=426638 RepID=A0AAD3GZ94_9STRA|nr:hypothetical protein CTEN210_00999 [Chaetoceros tenuissimus]